MEARSDAGLLSPLARATPRGWAARALAEPRALLSDHAHCELRAAAAAQSLIERNAGDARLVDKLSAMALEELRHFRQVLAVLREVGGEFRPAGPNPYADGLLSRARAGATDRHALLDRLLVASLIEQRSLERFELLAEAAADGPLRALYVDLGPSERGHAALFVELALARFDPERVRERRDELLSAEGELVASLPFSARVHSGWMTDDRRSRTM